MTDMANRREFKRQRKEITVRYSLLGSEEYNEARLVDVGEGGLCMETSAPIQDRDHDLCPALERLPGSIGTGRAQELTGKSALD